MIEIPEACTLARQLNESISGREIVKVIAAASPHKFAWFTGDPQDYPEKLIGSRLGKAQAFGGLVELPVGELSLFFGDGVNLRLYAPEKPLPAKHQLLIQLDDDSTLVASVAMYGGIWLTPPGGLDSHYFELAHTRPSPLSEAFDQAYFDQIWDEAKPSLSIKALLATEQRIPGLGNGVLQDILFNAKVNPRSKLNTLGDSRTRIFDAVKTTLAAMTEAEGRNTEKDLYGEPGGYRTVLSAKTYQELCPRCGSGIVRQAYMGGNVYYCPTCQPLP